uniref:DUF2848 domain-containing protein n=1 Tax=Rhodopseudomonas palustris (strain BisA53) TaxID=316055 RepID=Q07QN9_RHOP5
MADLAFTLVTTKGETPLTLPIQQAVIAGWTGRDPVARDKHIAELELIGIARPATKPIYYRVAASRLTTADRIEVSGAESSGEVEFVLIAAPGRMYVTVGSDHTDRKVERYGVTVSKQMCDKPIAAQLWDYAELAGHWDQIVLRAHAVIDGAKVLYQEGRLEGVLPVAELIAKGFDGTELPEGVAMFGGTMPAKGGVRPATRFEIEIEDPVLKRSIRHGYDIEALPILG